MKWFYYKDEQDTDKKIKDVRKQYHSNKNYTYCGLMTDWGLNNTKSIYTFNGRTNISTADSREQLLIFC